MISHNKIPQVVCEMWNLKMPRMFKNNVTMQTTAKFACNATSNICLMLALQALS